MFRGTLDEFSLTELIQIISQSGKTGVLEISGMSGAGRISFVNGAVSGAESRGAREPLGRKLVRAGAISEGPLRSTLERHGGTAVRLGEVLVTAGLVERASVDAALREQLEDAIVELQRTNPTQFEWHSASPEQTDFAVDGSSFVEGLRARLEVVEEVRRMLPSDDATICLAPTFPRDVHEVTLQPEDWRVLALLTSRRAVGDVLRYSGRGDVQALATLGRLLSAGLVEVGEMIDRERAGNSRASLRVSSPVPPPPPKIRLDGGDRVIRIPETPRPRAPQVDLLRVAFVCSANRVRGPVSVAALRRFAGPSPIEVASYGLEDLGPVPPTVEAMQGGELYGLDISEHRSRRLGPGALVSADLVLGFEWYHVDRAILVGGAPRERTFTLLELLDLLEPRPHVSGLTLPDAARLQIQRAHQARVRRVGDVAYFADALEMAEPAPGPRGRASVEAAIELLIQKAAELGIRLLGIPAPPSVARG